MAIIARTTRHPVAIHCPRCPRLSRDEIHLLYVASLVQAGECALAERTLRVALLSASGAEFALGPLEGLGICSLKPDCCSAGGCPPRTSQWTMP
jgi:hypothetical protein